MTTQNVFEKFFSSIFGGSDDDAVEQKAQLRPKARPEGLMSSLRPKARPSSEETEEPDKDATMGFVNNMLPYYSRKSNTTAVLPFSASRQAFMNNSTLLDELQAQREASVSGLTTVTARSGGRYSPLDTLLANSNKFIDDEADDLAFKTGLALGRKPEVKQPMVDYEFKEEFDPRSIQQNLVDKGYDIAVDGIIGPQTKKAIKDFQKKAGLKEDGVGAQTAKALGFESYSSDVTTEAMTSPVPGPDQMGVGFQDPDIVDPTTGRPYTTEALMRREKRLVASADASVAADAKEAEKVRNPEAIPFMAASASDAERFQFPVVIGESDKDTKSGRIAIQRALNELGYDVGKEDGIIGNRSKAAIIQFQKDNTLTPDALVGKRTAEAINKARKVTMGETATNVPTVPEETLKEASSRNLVDKAIEHGHIVGTIRDFLTDPSLKGLDFLSAYKRYGGYTSKLSELDPEGAAIVSQMGVNATGGKFNAAKDAWCALYIDGLLNLAGAERIGEGETAGQKKWKRLSALAYKNHGSSVTGAAPTQEEFNESAMRGDIIVIHSSFKITAKGNNVFYDAGGNVVLDKKGKPAKEHWISFKDMQKNEDGSYSYKPLDSISESINRLGRKQGLMLPKGRRETTKIMSEEISRYNGKGFTIQNQYHVGVNVGDAEDGFLKVLGGNQEDRVSVRTRAYPMESLVATRRVTYKDITPEFNKRLAVNDPAFSSAKKALKGLFN